MLYLKRFGIEQTHDFVVVVAGHDERRLLVRDIVHQLVHNAFLLDEGIERVVERRAAKALLLVGEFQMHFAFFQHDGHQAFVLHKEMGKERAVERAGEFKMAVLHGGAVHIDQLLVGIALEVEFATLQGVDAVFSDHFIVRTTPCEHQCQDEHHPQ